MQIIGLAILPPADQQDESAQAETGGKRNGHHVGLPLHNLANARQTQDTAENATNEFHSRTPKPEGEENIIPIVRWLSLLEFSLEHRLHPLHFTLPSTSVDD